MIAPHDGTLFARDAAAAGGWERDVRLEWNDEGELSRVTPGVEAGALPRRGPMHCRACPTSTRTRFPARDDGLAEARGHPTDDFWTWREEMYRLVRLLAPEDIEAIARHLYIEMLKHGYTTVAEFHYLHNDPQGKPYANRAELAERILTAAGDSGIAMTLLPVLYAHGGFGHKPLSPAQRRFGGNPAFILELLADLAAFHLPSPRLRLGIAPHSVRAVDALMLTELVDAATRLDATLPIHMHVSEQTGEVRECFETQGVTPIDWIMDLVKVDRRWCFVHATHATDEERERFREAGVVAGLCPTTEANLGDGIFPFAEHFERGGRWGIGGDSHVCVLEFDPLERDLVPIVTSRRDPRDCR